MEPGSIPFVFLMFIIALGAGTALVAALVFMLTRGIQK